MNILPKDSFKKIYTKYLNTPLLNIDKLIVFIKGPLNLMFIEIQNGK